ncbi:MAG: hypothetical protein ACXAAO_15815 [Candidatus Thorarchaeota archaeon]
MAENTKLDLPSVVRPEAVMDFLRRGHGYIWKRISIDPVLMILGHPAKDDHPEVVLMRDSLVFNSSEEAMRKRMSRMLELLERQAHDGVGR